MERECQQVVSQSNVVWCSTIPLLGMNSGLDDGYFEVCMLTTSRQGSHPHKMGSHWGCGRVPRLHRITHKRNRQAGWELVQWLEECFSPWWRKKKPQKSASWCYALFILPIKEASIPLRVWWPGTGCQVKVCPLPCWVYEHFTFSLVDSGTVLKRNNHCVPLGVQLSGKRNKDFKTLASLTPHHPDKRYNPRL